jgi:hypothetical protein
MQSAQADFVICQLRFQPPGTEAEASTSVTAAAPQFVRALGKILPPAWGVPRAGTVRLGLWMTIGMRAG